MIFCHLETLKKTTLIFKPSRSNRIVIDSRRLPLKTPHTCSFRNNMLMFVYTLNSLLVGLLLFTSLFHTTQVSAETIEFPMEYYYEHHNVGPNKISFAESYASIAQITAAWYSNYFNGRPNPEAHAECFDKQAMIDALEDPNIPNITCSFMVDTPYETDHVPVVCAGGYCTQNPLRRIYMRRYCPSGSVAKYFPNATPPGEINACVKAYEDGYYIEPEEPVSPEAKCGEGNPCIPSSGNKYQVETDYKSSLTHGIEFRRYYNSQGANKTGMNVAFGWRHTYSRGVGEAPIERRDTPQNLSIAQLTTGYYTEGGQRSGLFATPQAACEAGWNQIKGKTIKGLRSNTTASLQGELCKISGDGQAPAFLTVRSNNPSQSVNNVNTYSELLEQGGVMTVSRPNGSLLFFEKSGGSWISVSDPRVTLEQLVGGWLFIDNDDTQETYDNTGKLLTIVSREDYTQTLTYNLSEQNGGDGNPETLDKVIGPFGRELIFGYSSKGFLASVLTPDGLIKYKANGGQLLEVTYQDNSSKVYSYGSGLFHHALTGMVDENGADFARWEYDAEGRAKLSEHADGVERVEFVYNDDGTTDVTDASLGGTHTYTFESINGSPRVKSLTGDRCLSCKNSQIQNYSYDANGFLASQIDYNGNITRFEHDSQGKQTCRIDGYSTIESRMTYTSWDTAYHIPTESDVYTPPADQSNLSPSSCDTALSSWIHIKSTVYDHYQNGQVHTQNVEDPSSGASQLTTYTYDPNTKQLKTINGSRVNVTDTTTMDYEATTGNLTKITNALSHETTFSNHDANGRPQTITDPNGLVTTLTYHPRGWLTSRTVDGNTTDFDYDNVGQLTKLTLPTNAFIDYTYDAAHRLTDITDNLGNTIHYTLDLMGNRTKEETKNNAGNITRLLEREYDQLSQLLLLIGGQGQLTRYAYDLNGNQTAMTDPRNTGSNIAAAKTVDPLTLNNTSQSLYDSLNRLVAVTQIRIASNGTDDITTTYDYNALDQLIKVTDPESLETHYTYNALGDLLTLDSPDTGTTTYTYDSAGNRKSQTDARSITTNYNYDALNRLTSVIYPW